MTTLCRGLYITLGLLLRESSVNHERKKKEKNVHEINIFRKSIKKIFNVSIL